MIKLAIYIAGAADAGVLEFANGYGLRLFQSAFANNSTVPDEVTIVGGHTFSLRPSAVAWISTNAAIIEAIEEGQ